MKAKQIPMVLTAMALVLSSFAATAGESGKPARLGGKAEIRVTATVLPMVRLNVLSSRSTLSLSKEDATLRTASIRNAATIEVISNSSGYALHFDIVDPAVVEVEVEGLDAPVQVGAGGRSVMVSMQGSEFRRSLRTLNYRVRYAEGVAAGSRGMPVRVSVQNV